MTDYKLVAVEPTREMWAAAGDAVVALNSQHHDAIIESVYKAMLAASPVVQGEPVEFDYPDFHELGMGCGLEDRNITNRYEAMRYGWDEALDRVAETIDGLGPLYTAPQPAPEVAKLVEALEEIATWPDGGSRYGQRKIKAFAGSALADYRKQEGGQP